MHKYLTEKFGKKAADHVMSAINTFVTVFVVTIAATMDAGTTIETAFSLSSLTAAAGAAFRAVLKETVFRKA